MSRRTRKRGFTLVEILAVIAVVGVLLAFLIPAVRTARLASLNAKDLSHLRQLGIAHVSYQMFNDDFFVDVGLPHGGYGNEANSFAEVLKPYSDGVLLKSPLDDSPHWPVDLGGDGRGVGPDGSGPLRRTSYGMNNYLSRNYSPTAAIEGPGAATDRMTKIRRPERYVSFLHMTRTGSFAVSDHPHVESWSSIPAPWIPANTQITIWAADGSEVVDSMATSNYGFLDGSVAARYFEDVYQDVQENAFDPEAKALPR